MDEVLTSLSKKELEFLSNNIGSFSFKEQQNILAITQELERRNRSKRCQLSLIEFCKFIDPNYIVATHHKKLAELLEQIAYGEKDRVAVSIPPRHGKSHLVSTLFPAWFLGKFPDKKVLMVSHTTDLSVDFGRKVRNLIHSEQYKEIFPSVALAQDSKSAGRWNTNSGGEYFACGVGSNIAGRGADLLLVDDPHSEQDLLSGNFEALEKTYQWFMGGARTRLMSGGRVAIIHCMVGDTNVLMADGSEKFLRDVRPGDAVASYEHGQVTKARVLNWANQGSDRIYAIRTTSGKVLRANGKHPLLTHANGKQQWTKVLNLKVGMSLVGVSPSLSSLLPLTKSVALRDVLNESMHLASAHTTTTKIDGSFPLCLDLQNGGSGGVYAVQKKGVINQQKLSTPQKIGECVIAITEKLYTLTEVAGAALKKIGTHILSTDMALTLKSTISYSKNKMVNAPYAYAPQGQTIPHQTGMGNLGLTTAIMGSKLGHSYATHVTSLLAKETQKKPSYVPLSTYAPILYQIVEIVDAGYEDVFDMQVEGTENFIANGLVSHNTRWHQDDLIGHMVKDGANNEKADQYEIFEFPAVLQTSGGEKALWPEKFDLDTLARTKASMPAYQWNAQYMQAPTSEEAAIIKREWWRPWEYEDAPECEYIIMALDAAAETHNRADFTAITTWGVFRHDKITQGAAHLILLNSINVRVEFPELKDLALREYNEWEPDSFIVEKKSAGTQLYQELRRMGVFVQEFTPSSKTGDKVARLNAVADILRSGVVWYPEGRRWAEEVIEQCVAFPYGSNDDIVDTVSMTLARFRQGGFISLPSDVKDDMVYFKGSNRAGYY